MLRRDQDKVAFGQGLDRHHGTAARQVNDDHIGLIVDRLHLLKDVTLIDLADNGEVRNVCFLFEFARVLVQVRIQHHNCVTIERKLDPDPHGESRLRAPALSRCKANYGGH
jgi:hypothetical protein